MKREEYAARLRGELASVRVSPALRQRTLAALDEKERPIMKKKLTTAFALALATLLLCGAALAAADHWGLLDFVERYAVPHHVPENAPDYIQRDVASWETETLTIAMREMYYDGRYLQAVVDVKPRDSKTLLVSGMYSTSDWYANLRPDLTCEEDSRSVARFYRDGGYEKLLLISPAVTSDGETSQGCVLQEDGTLTFYLEVGYKQPQPVRDVTLRLLIQTSVDPENDQVDRSLDERATFPLTLTVPEGVVPVTWVSDAPQDFPEAGVRVDRLTVVAMPLSLYATIEYAIMDEERYAPLEDSLWFEFIDPESPEELPALQRLRSGFTGGGSIEAIGEGQFSQFETLGVNELRDEYTLRVFDAFTKDRYESRTFTMHEAQPDGQPGQ